MDDVTAAGIAALKAGDKANSATLLRRATIIDPNNQTAWLWLSGAVDTDDLRRSCLERVVAIDTTSQAGRQAAKGLAQLGPKVESVATPVIVATPATAVQAVKTQKPKQNSTTWGFFAIVGVVLLIGGSLVLLPHLSAQTVALVSTQQPTVAATRIPPSPTPDQGKWESSTSKSSFDDSNTMTIYLDANEPIEGMVKSYLPSLVIRCRERNLEAYINIGTTPEVEYGIDGATVRMRLDQEPAFSQVLSRSTDQRGLFFADAQQTINLLVPHQQLLVGFTPFNHSPVETSFDVQGLYRAVAPLTKACS